MIKVTVFLFRIASILDPRIKSGGFSEGKIYRKGIELLQNEISGIIKKQYEENTSSKSASTSSGTTATASTSQTMLFTPSTNSYKTSSKIGNGNSIYCNFQART